MKTDDDKRQETAWMVAVALAVIGFVLIMTQCRVREPTYEYLYIGVSDQAACSWDILHRDRGTCIDAGISYRCVATSGQRKLDEHGDRSGPRIITVQCAPPSPVRKLFDRIVR